MKKTNTIAIATICISVFTFTTTFAAPEDDFITKWRVAADDPTVPISAGSGYAYNYNVDCNNDGTNEHTNETSSVTCTYPTAGDYTIRISGTFPAVNTYWGDILNGRNDRKKIRDISQWGTGQWKSFNRAFWGSSNMTVTATDTPNLTASNLSMLEMFAYVSMADPDTTNWDTSNVTDMSFMFFNASLANPTTANWITSNVTNMAGMFNGASLANPTTTDWNTSKVTNMNGMFYNAPLANPDVSNWDVRNVTNMLNMFRSDSGVSVATPDVSRWQTDSLTGSIDGLFYKAAAANPDMSGWNISGVATVGSLFTNTAFSTTNYDKLLRSWSRQSLQPNITLGAEGIKYCNTAAHGILTDADTNNWTITDAGAEESGTCQTLAPHLTMDIDGNGSVQASTDGILIARYIASVRGASLIAGAVAGNASEDRNEADEIVAYLDSLDLDIDGNGGIPLASTDGILIARYIASVRDSALVDGAVAGNAKRTLPGITITLNNLDI